MKNRDWVFKYGLDFLCNHGKVDIESIAKFLNIDLHAIRYNIEYEYIRDKLEELEK